MWEANTSQCSVQVDTRWAWNFSHIVRAVAVINVDLPNPGTKENDFAVRRPCHLDQLDTLDVFAPDTISIHWAHYDSPLGVGGEEVMK